MLACAGLHSMNHCMHAVPTMGCLYLSLPKRWCLCFVLPGGVCFQMQGVGPDLRAPVVILGLLLFAWVVNQNIHTAAWSLSRPARCALTYMAGWGWPAQKPWQAVASVHILW